MTTEAKERPGIDLILLMTVLTLAAVGIVMVYSASAVFAEKSHDSAGFFLQRHALWAGIGMAALYFGAKTDFMVWRRAAVPLLLVSLALIGLCLVPGIGARAGGAARWLRLGPITIQPSEIAKFSLVVYLATVLSRRVAPGAVRQVEDLGPRARGLLAPVGLIAIMIGLVVIQPDLGSGVLLMGTAFLLFFAAGARVSYLGLVILAVVPIAYQKLIVETPWRMARVLAFLDPWSYRKNAGYQVSESLISVGSGGIFGQGLGEGKQKLFFLPEAHTDFIFAIIGEELGLIGLGFVVVCFAVILWRGTRAALQARNLFGTYLAFGITATLLLGAIVHMGVVLALLPTKGTTLPLISYGRNAMLMTLLSCGVLLNITAGNPEPVHERVRRGSEVGNQPRRRRVRTPKRAARRRRT